MTQIKICGIKNLQTIEVLNECKPEFVGFVFAKSKRQVSKEVAKQLRENLSPMIQTVGVFVNHDIDEVAELLEEGIIDVAQLHGNEDANYIATLKQKIDKPIIKAVTVSKLQDILDWQQSEVDFLLLDHGKGGTGETFSWDILRDWQREDCKPFFIAGGLYAGNVVDALEFEPFGVDVSSGVETENVKDNEKIREFIRLARLINTK